MAESSFNEELDRDELKALHRDFSTLVSILLEHVRSGSIIISDGWAAYSKLGDPINGVIFVRIDFTIFVWTAIAFIVNGAYFGPTHF